MKTIQEHLIEELGQQAVLRIRGARETAGNEPFDKEDDSPHPLHHGFTVERSFNNRAVFLFIDDSAAKRWEEQQQHEEEPHGVPPQATRRLTFSDRRAGEANSSADSDSDFYDPLEDIVK
jgi:hypothetical protein